MDENFKIGNFICERRQELGLTQADLGSRLNVTNKAVSRWENGRGLPDTSLILPLARVLGVTADELLRGEFITTVIPSKFTQEQAREEKNKEYSYICAKKLLIRDSFVVIPVFIFSVLWLTSLICEFDLSFGMGGYFELMFFNLVLPLLIIGAAQIVYAIMLILDTVKLKDKSIPKRILICVGAWFAVNYLFFFVYLYRIFVFFKRKNR